jgi:hemolysin-activating ACP:hemolysin acyltransferase
MTIVVKQLPDPWMALGPAAHFVARHDPFGRFPAADLIRTLSGQVHRGHYLFALDVSVKPARVVGYFGWELYSDDEAERFAASGVAPDHELSDSGSVVWILTAAADSRPAFFALVKATRTLYPAHRVMGIRHKTRGGKVTLDQSRARVQARVQGEH